MQPNDQQGYYQPDQNQPAQPAAPSVPQPTSAAPVTPAAPVAPMAESAPQAVGPVAVQAAFDESAQTNDEQIDEMDDQEAPVTWTAHEYIHQEKGTMWFVIFTVIVLIFFGLSLFLQQWSFAVLIVVIAAVVVVSSRRPPRELTYSLTDEGLTIDDKLHKFSNFKAFGIIRDGEEFSVMLIPVQRFQPGVTVYFPEEAGEDIVDMLGSRLPMKDLKLDAVDRIVRLLRL